MQECLGKSYNFTLVKQWFGTTVAVRNHASKAELTLTQTEWEKKREREQSSCLWGGDFRVFKAHGHTHSRDIHSTTRLTALLGFTLTLPHLTQTLQWILLALFISLLPGNINIQNCLSFFHIG